MRHLTRLVDFLSTAGFLRFTAFHLIKSEAIINAILLQVLGACPQISMPHVGSGVVIDPLRFLAECPSTRRLNQALSVLLLA